MKSKKHFKSGQYNLYCEINLGPNSQFFPNVAEIVISDSIMKEMVKGMFRKFMASKGAEDPTAEPAPKKDLTAVKTAIVDYVDRIAPKLKPEWMQGWHRFWEGLLDIDVIEKEIGNISKQQGTAFNRKLICNIICYLGEKHFFVGDYHPSEMARALEGDADHSIRSHALNLRPAAPICKQIDRYIELF